MRIAALLLMLPVSVAAADVPREPWDWTLEERVEARLEHLAATGRIDSNETPHLIYPQELFETVVRLTSRSRSWRGIASQSVDILTTDSEWDRFEELVAPYAQLLGEGPKADNWAEVCQARNEALNRVYAEFGELQFNRFLYRTRGGVGISYGTARPQPTPLEIEQELDYLRSCTRKWIPPTPGYPHPSHVAKPPRNVHDDCRLGRGYSPVLLDFRSASYTISAPEDGVSHDFDGDGIPSKTAWPVDPHGAAFLVFDRDANGAIDGAEEVLRRIDDLRCIDNTRDGMVTKRDFCWHRLALWYDVDRNGTMDRRELVSLDRAGVIGLELGNRVWVGSGDGKGNLVMNKGWFRFLIDGVETRRAMFQVCLATAE